ncbi:GSCFA domain-containing protein [Flavobacterium jejuense]|uniref:GSCFA domain-containing protein n=1 Tax=Flavobacterium jejuense TaxID=1544455 RepID=A0ABX0IWF0_9FLAO|nr:GSCFA domain-containing protein [Flavobacterium jejuense]NHN28028.1 GSCFA domain-containing protein [Flavobacterium jejuense]
MQFTTKIPISKSNNPIDYNSKILSLGSCFTENIGAKFQYYKFQTTTNPFGIIFNVVSIEKLVNRIVNGIQFTEKDVFYHNDLWHCYEVHSELSNPNKEVFLKRLNSIVAFLSHQILESTHVIITLGTSWVYRNIDSGEIVANCHKVPQKQFTKELLLVETIEKSITNIVALVHQINKGVKFIFTVSPVRHIKDGFVENTISKAHLISAIHKIINYQPSTINYFPSYEILLDELRDYRFYAEDMLHPNQVAIDYIWQRFKESVIFEEVFQTMDEIEAIQKALAHRPFNPNSESHKKFLMNLHKKIQLLQDQFPFVQF